MVNSQRDAELVLGVRSRRLLADDIVLLDLRRLDGGSLPDWDPGAHVDLHLPDGMVRQYSLCGAPSEHDVWRIAVLREPDGRGGSRYVHDRLCVGAIVHAGGPRNQFRFGPARRYEFIAGGIGITPLLPMIAAAHEAGAQWRLTYGGRSRRSMAFAEQLVAQYGDRVVLRPQDVYGLLDLDAVLSVPVLDTHVYCCGPGGLLDAVESRAGHWPPGTLHMERFEPSTDAVATGNRDFEIELAASGGSALVPADRSILDVVRERGVDVDWACEEGTCGSCITTVLAGEVEHRDFVLTPPERAEGKLMTICVSRAASARLVLDL